MYSPKISEDLIPRLYRMAKDRRTPMTRLVDGIIRNALANNNLPDGSAAAGSSCLYVRESEPRKAAA